MFENYVHSKEDLKAVEEAFEYLERPELDFIFKDRSLIDNTLVVSYDAKELFIWTKLKHSKLKKMPCRIKGYYAYRIKHKMKIKDEDQRGWRAGLILREIYKYLPEKFQKNWHEIPRISGGLLTPFVGIHKKLRKTKKRPLDAYCTRESYLATIIHEFGHVYYYQYKSKRSPEKERFLGYLRVASELYQSAKPKLLRDLDLKFPRLSFATELFAFCTDYHAASVFWPNHKKDVDRANRSWMKKSVKRKDVDFMFGDHASAAVAGKLLFEKYPEDWPSMILEQCETEQKIF